METPTKNNRGSRVVFTHNGAKPTPSSHDCPLFLPAVTSYNVSSRNYSNSLAENQQRNNLQVLSEPKPTCQGQASVFLLKEGDGSCEHFQHEEESNLEISTSQPEYARSLVLLKRVRLTGLLRSLRTTSFILSLVITMGMSAICFSSTAKAETVASFNSFNCIKALVGEVEGESFQTKLATAECLRNRGTLKGVYGINSKRISKASRKVWAECELAWSKSKASNLVSGATVWGNSSDVKIFKKTKWFKSYVQTAHVGNHYFFKLKAKKRGVK